MAAPPSTHLAVLLGNGVSVAAEPSLSMASLTADIRARFSRAATNGDPPDRVLSRLALRAEPSGDPVNDFEAMIGPLNQQRENLDDLRDLAELVGGEVKTVRNACKTIDTFVLALQRLGRGHALDAIAERSVASMDHRVVVDQFIDAIMDAVGTGRVVFGNLNYDLLVLASLSGLYQSQLCDMAFGNRGAMFDLGPDPWSSAPGHRLRTQLSDFPTPDRKIKLVHLHGSLTFLKNPQNGHTYKFPVNDLRMMDHWARWRDGETEWEPQVVLTNQSAKSTEVLKAPFALAYDVLREQLRIADRWLIAGYSFRDECVNEMLRTEFRARRITPQVMVVTYGDAPSEDQILSALGWEPILGDDEPADFLHVCREGISEAPSTPEWARWSGWSGYGRSALPASA